MPDVPELTFHGAARTVTGSCMELTFGASRILVDCGLFQGSRSLEALNAAEFAFAPESVDAVVLTHAHIDHCGLLPKLVARGFDGPVFCTPATADLLEYMLADSGRIQEYEAERRNRRRDRTTSEPFIPIYTEEDGRRAAARATRIPLGREFDPAPGFRARLWNAGHILGSASIEVEAGGVRMLFSGDLGPEHKAFHADPAGPAGIDHVVCESTYGGRTRPRLTLDQRREVLREEVTRAADLGGTLVIPSFALERTQELLLDLGRLADDGTIADTPIFVDSPLATRATEVFARYADDLEDTGGRNIFGHPAFRFTEDAEESMRIDSVHRAIVVAASGMCEAGRIRHHLRNNLPRSTSTVLFVGYQAQGSLGRVILDGAQRVRMSGEDIDVRAQIRRTEGYSAHADHAELVDWIGRRTPVAGGVLLDHGEPDALAALAASLRAAHPSIPVVVPELGARYRLPPGAPAEPIGPAPARAAHRVGPDWQNAYADFAVTLRDRLLRIADPRARERAIADMRAVLDSHLPGGHLVEPPGAERRGSPEKRGRRRRPGRAPRRYRRRRS